MQSEQKENGEAPSASSGKQDVKRERSTIDFAYSDLDDAVGVARAIAKNAGMSCTLDQLAAYLKQSMNSGTFRLRTSNARIFGLTENGRRELQLTELGRRIADDAQESEARVEAFLHVPLYAKIFDDYKGYSLPGPAALERHMGNLGVADKQKGRARQAFMRSARQAGFFVHGEDRLVRPAPTPGGFQSKPLEAATPSENEMGKGGGKGGDGGGDGKGGDGDLHPFILGLLKTLPAPDSEWPIAARAKWLQTAASIFGLIYVGDGSIKVEVTEHTP